MITVKTNRPILSEPTSNCCGMSGADGMYSDSFEMSNADGEKGSLKDLIAMGKDYMSDQKADRKDSRGDAVKNILNDRAVSKINRRDNRADRRTERQSARALRIEARHTRRTTRKANRNAKKLTLIKTSRGDKFFFPLSRVRLGKKKYKDGTEVQVKPEEQVKVFDQQTKEEVILDKKEIANALDKPVAEVTNTDAQQMIQKLNLEISELKRLQAETGDKPTETPYGLMVDDSKVEVVEDGEAYLKNQTQDKDKTTEDVKDKEKGLSKTQKIVLWSGVGVATLLVGYLIYKAVKKQ
jgi:hypothetical protein